MRMDRRPIVWFAVWWICGSAAAAAFGSRGALLAAGACMLLAPAAALCRQASWKLAAACALAAALAAGERIWADERNVTALPELLAAAEAEGPRAAYPAEAAGTIVSAVEVDGDRVRFRMAAELVHVEGEAAPRHVRERLLVQLRLAAQPEQAVAAAWARGDKVRVAGELALPAAATNSGGFDYRRYLRSQRVHWLLKGQGAAAVSAAAGPPWSAAALLGRVDGVRAWLGARMDVLYPAGQSGYMKGLVLGIRDDLDPEQFQQFSRLGLTHILAISGLHVAVFLYALAGLLRLARLTRERILFLLMLAVPLYVLLSGASPSVMRAGLMAVLGLFAARLGKLKDGLHLLAAAAVLMLAVNPFYIEDVSFQLSFLVTLGLILGVPPVRSAMPELRRGKALLDLAAVTAVAQAVSFPVTIYYFNQFHALSLFANFVLVPFISFVVLPLGAVSLLIGLLWEEGGKLAAYGARYANDWTFALVEWMAKAEPLRSIWATPPVWWVAAYLALLGTAFHIVGEWAADRSARRKAALDALEETAPLTDVYGYSAHAGGIFRADAMGLGDKRAYGARFLPCICAFGLLLGFAYMPDLFDRRGIVSFIDVGQGDSIHIRTPGQKHILIDGGGTISFLKPGEEWRQRSDPFEIGAKLLVPLLMKRGVREIDLLVLSHLDSDHIRGLQAVVESIPVRAIWWNGTVKRSEDSRALLELAASNNIPMYGVHAGMHARPDARTSIDVYWPPESEASGRSVTELEEQNESSVVLRLQMYGASFLFAGDINETTEKAVIRLSENNGSGRKPDPVSVMKVSHHGSRFSTGREWLAYWKPAAAVASVGATNSYGHPHKDVLSRLKEAETAFWRTDLDGEVQFSAANDGLFVRLSR
ncbi:DNA internalization-related competence protein ComEC/Rec2 [Paenibacillus sp. N4]|uniref:DNA internalization-related competence protein ComEC/Rec2 n=1 Tax=Paenibacillus vietnamensis TaxID=2590547 RepID=UPI001CD0A451|nr:DNA internalization-related competence protein ComEC/Rec2 [Paenibacillus vietnamensis]MCA0754627.1 DNA internalization-related competence protein ComEC/Rec2 [Paenibacillus vietnamensis]